MRQGTTRISFTRSLRPAACETQQWIARSRSINNQPCGNPRVSQVTHLRVHGTQGLRVTLPGAVRPDRLSATADDLAAIAHDWDRRLATIKRLAEAGDARS